jgi:hypothetical protein
MAAEIGPFLGDHRLAIAEHDDIEVTVDVHAGDVFTVTRIALDRVESAFAESPYVAPELLAVEVEGIFEFRAASEQA